MASELKHTVMPSGGDFTTLAAAVDHLEAAHADLVSADVYATIEIDGTWSSPDTASPTIHNITTDATRYISIYTTAAARHDGKWDTGAYILELTNADGIVCDGGTGVNYVRFDGLQVHIASGNANSQDPFTFGNIAASNQFRISNSIIRHHGLDYTSNAIYPSSNTNLDIWNTVIYGFRNATGNARPLQWNGNVLNLYNCTIISGYIGVNYGTGTITAKNTYVGGTGGADWNGTITMSYCGSADGTATGTGEVTEGVDTDTFVNVSAGTEDFHLAADGDSLLEGAGDAPGGAAPLNYTTDIDGDTCSDWCIGADHPAAAGGDVEVPITGVSGTASVGTLALSLALALSGLVGTGAVGTLSPPSSVPISGIEATASPGTIPPAMAAVLAGIEALGAVGDVTPSTGMGDISIPITGVSANPSYPIYGVGAAGAVGDLTAIAASGIILPITGVGATGEVGTVTCPTAGGEGMTGEVGDVALDISPPLTGIEATAAVGDAGQDRSVGLIGAAAVGEVGGWNVIFRSLTGNETTGGSGTLTPNITRNLKGPSELFGPLPVGYVGVLVQSHDVPLTGIAASGVPGYLDTFVAGDLVLALTGVGASMTAGTLIHASPVPIYYYPPPRKRIIAPAPRKRIIDIHRRRV